MKRNWKQRLALAMAFSLFATAPLQALTNDYTTVTAIMSGTNNAFDFGMTTGLTWVAIGLVVGALFFGLRTAFKKKPR